MFASCGNIQNHSKFHTIPNNCQSHKRPTTPSTHHDTDKMTHFKKLNENQRFACAASVVVASKERSNPQIFEHQQDNRQIAGHSIGTYQNTCEHHPTCQHSITSGKRGKTRNGVARKGGLTSQAQHTIAQTPCVNRARSFETTKINSNK
jgi:hypothetical protein